MTKGDKNASHASYHDEGEVTAENEVEVRQDAEPFHGALHSDHPRDPFRNDFAHSSLKFEF